MNARSRTEKMREVIENCIMLNWVRVGRLGRNFDEMSGDWKVKT